MDTLNAIHAKMRREVVLAGGVIDAIFVCPHGPDDGCDCRKPKPGLLNANARPFDTKLKNVQAVGESLRNLQADRRSEEGRVGKEGGRTCKFRGESWQ